MVWSQQEIHTLIKLRQNTNQVNIFYSNLLINNNNRINNK
jgi:hypothetical protein